VCEDSVAVANRVAGETNWVEKVVRTRTDRDGVLGSDCLRCTMPLVWSTMAGAVRSAASRGIASFLPNVGAEETEVLSDGTVMLSARPVKTL
jgi:hypothetical protein